MSVEISHPLVGLDVFFGWWQCSGKGCGGRKGVHGCHPREGGTGCPGKLWVPHPRRHSGPGCLASLGLVKIGLVKGVLYRRGKMQVAQTLA